MKDKQIEEMAQIIAAADDICLAKTISMALYDAGYRKQEWISVEDRLPENPKDVLCYYRFGRGDGDLGMMFVGTLCYFCFDKNPHWQHSETGLVVTHWMPLPEPPKGEENDLVT